MMMMFVNETEADDHPEPDSNLLIGDSYVTKYTSLLCSYFVRLLSQICLLAPIAPRSICFYSHSNFWFSNSQFYWLLFLDEEDDEEKDSPTKNGTDKEEEEEKKAEGKEGDEQKKEDKVNSWISWWSD